MKEFDIHGKLFVNEDISHQELLEMLYKLLGSSDIHFSGLTKEVINK